MAKATRAAQRWNSGYEKGSVASYMTDEQRRQFRAWLKERDSDLRAYIAGFRQAGAIVAPGPGNGGYRKV